MEVITIEKRAFEVVNQAFEHFIRRMDEVCSKQNKSVTKWLDSSDVCQLLNISKRTLQTYRDNGSLPYSQINHKMYYKHSDIERLFKTPLYNVA